MTYLEICQDKRQIAIVYRKDDPIQIIKVRWE